MAKKTAFPTGVDDTGKVKITDAGEIKLPKPSIETDSDSKSPDFPEASEKVAPKTDLSKFGVE